MGRALYWELDYMELVNKVASSIDVFKREFLEITDKIYNKYFVEPEPEKEPSLVVKVVKDLKSMHKMIKEARERLSSVEYRKLVGNLIGLLEDVYRSKKVCVLTEIWKLVETYTIGEERAKVLKYFANISPEKLEIYSFVIFYLKGTIDPKTFEEVLPENWREWNSKVLAYILANKLEDYIQIHNNYNNAYLLYHTQLLSSSSAGMTNIAPLASGLHFVTTPSLAFATYSMFKKRKGKRLINNYSKVVM